MEIIWILFGILIGICVGVVLMAGRLMTGVAGTLIMNNQYPEENPLLLELEEDPDAICKSKYIKLKISASKYTPRK